MGGSCVENLTCGRACFTLKKRILIPIVLILKSELPNKAPSFIRITACANAYCFILAIALLSACTPVAALPPATPTLVTMAPPTSTAVITPAPTHTPTPTSTPVPTATPAPVVCSPLAVQPLEKLNEIITQPFIMPRTLADGTYRDDDHHGVDLGYYTREGKPFTGTPVLSALEGTIASVIHDRPPYGNMVMVETPYEKIPASLITLEHIPPGNSIYTLYAHLQNLQPLETGMNVNCGQQLAETGLTGFTGGPHLHFETRWGPQKTTFPAMGFYRADMTPEENQNYTLWRMSGKYILFDPMFLLRP